MDLPAFMDTLDLYGADRAAWPIDLRAASEPLLARSAAARQAMATVEEIEGMLRAGSYQEPGGDINLRIDALGAVAMRHRQDRPASPLARPAVRAVFVASAAVMLGLGLLIGWGTGEPDEGPAHALAIAFDSAGSIDVD